MQIGFSTKLALAGDLVTLAPVAQAHVGELHRLMSDPEVARLTGSVHTSSPSAAELQPWTLDQLIEIYGRWASASDRIVWAILENAAGSSVIGEAVLSDLNPDNLSCSFRIWTSGARGRGLGTQATRLVVQHGFDVVGLHRIELEVYDFNPRARHVYTKVGFKHEGTLREALRYDDGWVDAHLMAMLSSDPRG